MKTIAELMGKEHERINSMLVSFAEAAKSKSGFESERTKEKFNKFKWNLMKHFLAEERAIFSLHQLIEGQEVSDIFDLMQEHGKIRGMVESIEKELETDKEVNILELEEVLESHSRFEDDSFYPRLDEKLSEVDKERLIDRVKEELRE